MSGLPPQISERRKLVFLISQKVSALKNDPDPENVNRITTELEKLRQKLLQLNLKNVNTTNNVNQLLAKKKNNLSKAPKNSINAQLLQKNIKSIQNITGSQSNNGMNIFSQYVTNSATSNLQKQRNNARIKKLNLNKRKVASKINGNINRQQFTNQATILLEILDEIIVQVENKETPINSVSIDNSVSDLVDKIGDIRMDFANQLKKRLVDTINQTGKFNAYMYYKVNGLESIKDNTFEKALNATTGTINAYTSIVRSLNNSKFNYGNNLKTNVLVPSLNWPAIMKMDGILLNYNSASTRVAAVQNVNVNSLAKEIESINKKLQNIKNNENKRSRNELLSKLKKLKNAIGEPQ